MNFNTRYEQLHEVFIFRDPITIYRCVDEHSLAQSAALRILVAPPVSWKSQLTAVTLPFTQHTETSNLHFVINKYFSKDKQLSIV